MIFGLEKSSIYARLRKLYGVTPWSVRSDKRLKEFPFLGFLFHSSESNQSLTAG